MQLYQKKEVIKATGIKPGQWQTWIITNKLIKPSKTTHSNRSLFSLNRIYLVAMFIDLYARGYQTSNIAKYFRLAVKKEKYMPVTYGITFPIVMGSPDIKLFTSKKNYDKAIQDKNIVHVCMDKLKHKVFMNYNFEEIHSLRTVQYLLKEGNIATPSLDELDEKRDLAAAMSNSMDLRGNATRRSELLWEEIPKNFE